MTARTGARVALTLGLLASLAGNALAAQPTLLGRVVAAWAPLALAVVVWLVEHYRPALGPWRAATWAGTGVVASVAAWVSYWHLVRLAHGAGESGAAAYLLPLSVDGLILVATAYLREAPAPAPAPKVRKVAPVSPSPVSPVVLSPKAAPARVAADQSTATVERGDGAAAVEATSSTSSTRGRTSPVPAERVRRLAAEHPDWTQAEVAEALGCSVRTVRRHLTAGTTEAGLVPAAAEGDIDALLDELTDAAPAAAMNGAHA